MDIQEIERNYREQLARWQDEIDELKAQATEAGEDAHETARQRIAELEEKRDAAGRKLEELRDAGHHAAAELKVGLEMAFTDLRHGMDAARMAVERHTSG